MAINPYSFFATGLGQQQESEEDRRRRLEREAQERRAAVAPAAPVKPTPVKETITTDPVTGERKIRIEGTERDLSAANVLTPTVTMPGAPVAPEDIQRDQREQMISGQPQAQPMPQPMPQPQAQPTAAAPVAPMAPEDIQRDQREQAIMGQPPGAAQQPVAPPQPGAPVPTVADLQATAQQGQQTAAQVLDWTNILNGSQASPKILDRVMVDPAAPPDVRAAAVSNKYRSLQQQRDMDDANRRATEMVQKNDGLGISRELKKQDGSYIKAVLLGLLGAKDMARTELNKLGHGGTWVDAIDPETGKSAGKIRVRDDGLPMEGIDLQGQAIPSNRLAALSAGGGAKDLDIVGGSFVNDVTGEVGRMVTNKRTGMTQIQTDTGLKPMKGFRPQGQAGSLSDMRTKMIQDLNLQLKGKSIEEAQVILRPYNQALAGQGLPIIQPTELNIQAGQISGAGGAQAQGTAEPPPPPLPPAADGQPVQQRPAGQVSGAQAQGSAQATGPDSLRPSVSGVAATSPRGRPTLTDIQARSGAAAEAAKTPPLVARADQEAFVKFKNEDILPKADTGAKLAGIRRDQIYGPDGVLNNPEIAGLLSGTGGQAREFQNIFRDIVGGNFEKVDDMSTRIKASGLDQRTKEVLQVQLQRQREVTPLMIRDVAPVGTITDFEQRMAKDAGIDVLRQGLYSSLTNLTRNQFQSDMAAYKRVFAERNPQLVTRGQFDQAWNKEKSRLDEAYRQVYEDRARYIGKYNKDGKNNNATIVAFRDHYPVPRFDSGTGEFVFEGFARQRQRPPLSNFERQ